MKAEEFDKKFNDGEEDITGLLDLSKARRPAYEQRRVNVDFRSACWTERPDGLAFPGSL